MSDFTAKYRPQKIADLDLVSARDQISKILSSENPPQALLFSGPRGIGKTSAARIVAKVVNCESGNAKRDTGNVVEPCNKCDQCISITNGSNLDVIEIDAASNRGIDDIRDLREKVRLAPIKAHYKVYIIDEVHMLTTEAFNALLKTLEEPPKHVIFILCTTAPEKLPETILSRCLRINFKRANETEIIDKLKKITKEEKIEIDEEALEQIAKTVSGSFRDAAKILEQLAFSKEKITKENVKENLDQMVGLDPQILLEILPENNIPVAIKEINRIVEGGGNLKVYTERLLELLRIGLLIKLGIPDLKNSMVFDKFEINDFKKLIDIFSKASFQLRDASIPQLPLEMAVVEWCTVSKSFRSTSGSASSAFDPGASPVGDDSEILKPASNIRSSHSTISETELENKEEKKSEESKISNVQLHDQTSKLSIETIHEKWPEVLLGVRPKNHSIEGLLRSTKPMEFKDNFLVLEVFYKFHKDKLESEKCREILEGTLNDVYKEPIKIKCVLGERPAKIVKDPEEEIIKSAEEIFSTPVE